MARPIFYDTETTGVRSDKDRIIEIAAYDPVLNRTFEKFINPGMPIPPEATQIHKITDDMVADAPGFAVIGREFAEFCQGDVILVAHNNDSFDAHFLRNEYERHGLELPKWRYFDTLKWARKYRPDLPRHTLQFLREIYGIAANNAHRALDDVVVLHRVYTYMVDDLTIDDAASLLTKEREINSMPFGKHQGMPLAKVPKDYILWLAGNGAFEKPENAQLKSAFEKLGVLQPTAA